MGVTAEEYVWQLKELLPPGPAWPRGDSASMFALLFEVWANELARVDARAASVIIEADPRYASESFQEWLDQWGLPDECLKAWDFDSNFPMRQVLLWKMTSVGSPNLKFFRDLAAMLGYQVVIDEFRIFRVTSKVIEVLADENWAHYWRVDVLASKIGKKTYHQVTGGAQEALAWRQDSLLECLIRKYAPAHTEVLFAYFDEVTNG